VSRPSRCSTARSGQSPRRGSSLLGLVEREGLAARLLVDPAAAARATLAEVRASFDEGHGTRDLREATVVLERAAQLITPEPASASTSIPSATR